MNNYFNTVPLASHKTADTCVTNLRYQRPSCHFLCLYVASYLLDTLNTYQETEINEHQEFRRTRKLYNDSVFQHNNCRFTGNTHVLEPPSAFQSAQIQHSILTVSAFQHTK